MVNKAPQALFSAALKLDRTRRMQVLSPIGSVTTPMGA